MDQDQAYVELQFWPSPELIPIVRRFVSSFYERLLSEEEVASRLALATHELLENTVKFSLDNVSSVHLEVRRGARETAISVRTRNRSTERDQASAAAIVDEIRSAADPFAYYQQAMRRNARREEGSGLGLARVCAEAEMDLDCAVEGDELVVTARVRLPVEAPAGAPDLPEIAGPTFAASSTFDGRALTVRLSGSADMSARGVLESLLARVHAEALRSGTAEVIVDLTALEFMNSFCFRHFVTWLSDVQDLSPDRQYRIRLVSSPTVLWQRRSLHALKCFADELVSIEVARQGAR